MKAATVCLWTLLCRNFPRLLKFVAVSMPTSGLNLLVSNYLVEVRDVNYFAAMFAGLAFQVPLESYFNSRWTFKEGGVSYRGALYRTAFIEIFCTCISIGLTSIRIEIYGDDFFWGRLLSMTVTGTISLALAAFFTYRK